MTSVISRTLNTLFLCCIIVHPLCAQVCTHPLSPSFYESNHYKVGKITLRSPFDFFFLVRNRLNSIKLDLPLKERERFSAESYDQSFKMLDERIKADSVFGQNSPVKVVVTTGGLERCYEGNEGTKTVDVIYRIFSSDPIPAVHAPPEERLQVVEEQASQVAQQNTSGMLQFKPSFGYSHATRGYGGGDVRIRIPGRLFNEAKIDGTGSPTSSSASVTFVGSQTSHFSAINHADYAFGYSYQQRPTPDENLARGYGYGKLNFLSAPKGIGDASVTFRYGISVEKGIQQSSTLDNADRIANSRFSAVHLYGGIASVTRYSEVTVSYAFEAAGTGLLDTTFTKHLGDATYSTRFPAGTHAPWDLNLRISSGGISGGPVLINDSFLGGNVVSTFAPEETWRLPEGPLVRSIAANRMINPGVNGVLFYSTNFTLGKVIKSWPMISERIEQYPGFADGVAAAEDTAEGFFADGYESGDPASQDLATKYIQTLTNDINAIQAVLQQIRAAGNIDDQLELALTEAERALRSAQGFLRNAEARDDKGHVDVNKLKTANNPRTSRFVKLLQTTANLRAKLSGDLGNRIEVVEDSLREDLAALKSALEAIHNGPVGQNAMDQAKADMQRPREVVDTLRHEANSFAISLYGMFDSGRLWPDTTGNHYGMGGGVRLSIVNVNFNFGYSINPSPQRQLGQGRGAILFNMSYTNLFR